MWLSQVLRKSVGRMSVKKISVFIIETVFYNIRNILNRGSFFFLQQREYRITVAIFYNRGIHVIYNRKYFITANIL